MIREKLALVLIMSCFLLKLSAEVTVVDSLENLLQNHPKEDTLRVILLTKTAYAFWSINPEKLLKYAEEAERLADKLNFPKGKSNSLRKLATYYWTQSDYLKSIEYYKASLDICQKTDDKKGMAGSYYGIGMMRRLLGDYQAALENYKKSLELKIGLGDKKGISTDYLAIGMIYFNQGDYPKAMEYYQNSLKIKEEINDKAGISHILNNIGSLYGTQEDYPESLKYYKKSLIIKEELGDNNGKAYCLNNIGIICRKQGDYQTALEYYKKALEIREVLGDKRGIVSSYNSIGEIYNATGDYSKSLEFYQKSLQLSIKIGNKKQESINNVGLGSLYLKQKNVQKAYKYSKKGYEIAKKIGDAELLRVSSEILSKSSGILGLYEEAYKYQVVFKTMNDSLYDANSVKKITGLEYNYKFEKEKQAIELVQQKKDAVQAEESKRQKFMLNAFIVGFILILLLFIAILRSFLQKRNANRILTDKNAIITKQKEEKELLVKEIHHRVKNNLQIISSLFDLQLRSTDNPETKSTLIDGLNRVKSVGLIHQLLYQSEDVIHIDFGDFVEKLLDHITSFATKKEIKQSFVIPQGLQFDIATTLPLGLIITELLTNAFKYAFDNVDACSISIKLDTTDDGQCRLEVRDNGSGFPDGFDFKTPKTLGLRLVRALSIQIAGEINYRYDNGARFLLTFPKGN
jgi:two-component system, sensor histidine kinase PdtaS